MEDLETLPNDEEEMMVDEDEYRQKFLSELKKRERLEKAKEQIIFNGDDDDDKFIVNFDQDENEAESFLNREKRKAEKKELKRKDHSLE